MAFFSGNNLVWFILEGSAGLINDLGSISSSSICFVSLYRTGVMFSLNVW